VTTFGVLANSNRHALADALRAACPGAEVAVADTVAALRPDVHRLDGLILATQFYDRDLAALLHEGAPRLRWVQALSSGVDSILKHGIPDSVTLTSSVGVHADPVADHALAMLLGLFRRIPEFALAQAGRDWAADAQRRRLREVAGCRATMLGYGHIGRGIVRRLQACGAVVTAVNRSGTGPGGADRLLPVSALAEALDGADILIICLPGEAAARPLIDGPALDRLAPGAVVVNVGRGTTLETAALVARLQDGRLAGAGLDVFEHEPLTPDDPLWQVPGLLISPHLAGNAESVQARLAELSAENARRFVAGTPLRNAVTR
jgi:phosphoglycerate dehydrogenase-like enzyme